MAEGSQYIQHARPGAGPVIFTSRQLFTADSSSADRPHHRRLLATWAPKPRHVLPGPPPLPKLLLLYLSESGVF